ncbi:hypothetical protein IJ135_02175 [Candidatus Saccharibacteria bacterium]|nr:hypothetical protein [Candidatus Saccharibacteria bacterium]
MSNTKSLVVYFSRGDEEGSGNSGTYASLAAKLPASTLKGGGFNITGTAARTDAGIKELDAWLAGLQE